MKIILLRCAICDYWYAPHAHAYHCPVCAAHPFVVQGQRKYFHILENKAIEVVRGIKRVVPNINLN